MYSKWLCILNECVDPDPTPTPSQLSRGAQAGIGAGTGIIAIAWICCMAFFYCNEKKIEEGFSEKGMYAIVKSIY